MTPDRPQMPPGYQIAKSAEGMLAWEEVEERLTKSRNYWISTTRPDGRPHVMPVWGVWLNGTFCFGTDRGSRKARNLAANPAAVVHLESGNEAVIVEGVAKELTATELKAVDEAYHAKYSMKVSDAPGDGIYYAIHPQVIFAWREKDFPQSATRWTLSQPT
jgi:nitroimidazol reductase NimA-like FMN-containing flavoprotein (pyridoxamine 5'-phosphate oxidase superfamily)